MSKSKSSSSKAEPLACPSCALGYPLEERFCARCGMPLVYMGGQTLDPVSDAHAHARKIDPRYAEGELVWVAGGRNQAEAELIQGMLLEEGVPSLLRRSAGFDVPDFLAGGPRDILVPASGVDAARELLVDANLAPTSGLAPPARHPGRLVAAVLGGAGFATLLAWLLLQTAD